MGEVEKVKKDISPFKKMIYWGGIAILIVAIPLFTFLFLQRDIYFAKEVRLSNILGIVLLVLFFVAFLKSFINNNSTNKIVNLIICLWIFYFSLRYLKAIIMDLDTIIFIISISATIALIPFFRFLTWRRRYLDLDKGKWQYKGATQEKQPQQQIQNSFRGRV